ncbi:unnamed protein product, partial [Bubo scandiacus]
FSTLMEPCPGLSQRRPRCLGAADSPSPPASSFLPSPPRRVAPASFGSRAGSGSAQAPAAPSPPGRGPCEPPREAAGLFPRHPPRPGPPRLLFRPPQAPRLPSAVGRGVSAAPRGLPRPPRGIGGGSLLLKPSA